jgi:hypothetical protein
MPPAVEPPRRLATTLPPPAAQSHQSVAPCPAAARGAARVEITLTLGSDNVLSATGAMACALTDT